MNPLIEFPNTLHQTLAFDNISTAHFMPAAQHWMSVAKKRQDDIVANPEPPSFFNTVEALEFASLELGVVTSCFFNLNSAETNEEIQAIARELSPMLTKFGNETLLNRELFLRIKAVWEQRESEELSQEAQRLLKETYESFVRNGALLEGEDREKLTAISDTLSRAGLSFGEHVLKETQAFEYTTTDQSMLEGLPEGVLIQAKNAAEEKGVEGYWMGLDMPTYMSIMKYASRPELRELYYRAYASRGANKNEFNNEEVIKTLVNQRLAKAQLLGFESHAALTLSKRMAGTPDTVLSFLEDLKKLAKPAAQKDLEAVENFAQEQGASLPLRPWDFSYWSERLKKATLSLDDEILKPYFQLQGVLGGAFEVANRLFGLRFEKNTEISTYHEEVDAYEVFDAQGSFLSVLYTDFFPRSGKRAGAWMTSYKSMYQKDGQTVRPHISIVCNFTRPTADQPALLTFNEVTTLFHEFGHALHGMMAEGTYPSLTGTSVYWDFVELPSQIMENWCYQPDALALFARHYQTGEVLPESYIERIVESQRFMEGYATLRQLNFGFLDMAWHHNTSPFQGDVVDFEAAATKDTQLFDKVEGTLSSTAFSHIFQGGYSAGYYSYKWAEVLDADAFERFEQEGIFSKEVANDFARILKSGGTVAPDVLFEDFRGRAPKIDALLKRAGISAE